MDEIEKLSMENERLLLKIDEYGKENGKLEEEIEHLKEEIDCANEIIGELRENLSEIHHLSE